MRTPPGSTAEFRETKRIFGAVSPAMPPPQRRRSPGSGRPPGTRTCSWSPPVHGDQLVAARPPALAGESTKPSTRSTSGPASSAMFRPTPLMSYFSRGERGRVHEPGKRVTQAPQDVADDIIRLGPSRGWVLRVIIAQTRPPRAVEAVLSARGQEVVVNHFPHLVDDLQVRRRRGRVRSAAGRVAGVGRGRVRGGERVLPRVLVRAPRGRRR